jgi:septal ring factor EnvC (AmiA/AmiB activator)
MGLFGKSSEEKEADKSFKDELKKIEKEEYLKALNEEKEAAKEKARERARERGKQKAKISANRPSIAKAFVIGAKKTAADFKKAGSSYKDASSGMKKYANMLPPASVMQMPKGTTPFGNAEKLVGDGQTKKLGDDLLGMAEVSIKLKKAPSVDIHPIGFEGDHP